MAEDLVLTALDNAYLEAKQANDTKTMQAVVDAIAARYATLHFQKQA
jgi:hypothetical protein